MHNHSKGNGIIFKDGVNDPGLAFAGKVGLWRPRFLISVINANGRISWVKPADVGPT
jgi:hypothetical protein